MYCFVGFYAKYYVFYVHKKCITAAWCCLSYLLLLPIAWLKFLPCHKRREGEGSTIHVVFMKGVWENSCKLGLNCRCEYWVILLLSTTGWNISIPKVYYVRIRICTSYFLSEFVFSMNDWIFLFHVSNSR